MLKNINFFNLAYSELILKRQSHLGRIFMALDLEDLLVKRMTVSMEDDLYAKVDALANLEQRTVPNLLVYLAAKAVREAEAAGELPSEGTTK
ncbi:hypothetical protein [Phormidium sp. FACHB-1136]|jgi:hypothetical protein|uniref:ribbon-helix-helix domain-containing protein n=1 Tax=Phormidium sp. FACHB-1136 TaxID=2692848 RepID=UPI0016895D08|nr:hypothetical protein [Phormidium sp. FACHB-1136]MBD2428288.1 hypothetical protein [Phormidium sp. FACHB-1136]